MPLVKAKQWIQNNFALGSQPKIETIKRWIELGELNGQIINGNCFIEDNEPFAKKELNIKKIPAEKAPVDNARREIQQELEGLGFLPKTL